MKISQIQYVFSDLWISHEFEQDIIIFPNKQIFIFLVLELIYSIVKLFLTEALPSALINE